jgi:membrane protein
MIAVSTVLGEMRAFCIAVRDAVVAWVDDRCPTMAASVAFFTAFSLAPTLLIVIAVAGAFFGEDAVRGQLFAQIEGIVGTEGASAIQAMVANAWTMRGTALVPIVSVAITAVGATACFAELNTALNTIWRYQGPPDQPVWKGLVRVRLISFALVIGVSFLLIALLVVDAALAFVGEYILAAGSASAILLDWTRRLMSLALLAVAFAILLKVLPSTRVKWRDIALGAITAALLFAAGKRLFGLYLSTVGTASTFGAAGSLAVVLMWLFYSAAVFLFGAELTAIWARRRVALRKKKAGLPADDAHHVHTPHELPRRSEEAAVDRGSQ